MTFEQLRIFVAVAEREHVTRAAAALHLTQSAVSAAIAALEERHAVCLFDRVGRRIVLTDAGRLFLGEAQAVLARVDQAERVLGDLAGLRRGTLRLGASQTVANYWLPPLMQRFHAAHPGFALELITGNTTEIVRMVEAATVDLGFVEGAAEAPRLAVETLPGDELALVVAPAGPWAATPGTVASGEAETRAAALAAMPWVLREPGSGTRAVCETALAGYGLGFGDIEVALELPSNEAVRAAVVAGAGATILSTLVVGPSIRAGELIRLPFDLPPRPFHVLRHRDRHVSRAEARFLDLAQAGGAL
ncbi:LysR family transcriptional regulator [Pseudodonghicola flavimaris]|uniref:LysR substrate-binding domain-containing protein n=1 Tax=Pseudodonghicola flavimaris TaxID=3050036 RepID=A0ABT7F096_9RHOB|nr:LysR substrate-binding domain-containing protein [Pseudodonghicola flavimaris]MDK3018026.1 LysR substrate-binding domain-containing protein [Pseudodonghicola flavimaris]